MINVSTGEFYGPFDLLLELIKKSKYDIYDVKISEITNEYINSINEMDIPADETADFILIATQLLYLKTKSLIKDTSEEDEDDEFLISEDELIRRLTEYKKIKSLIPYLREKEFGGLKKHTKFQEDLSKYAGKEKDFVYDVQKLKEQIELLINKYLNEDNFEVDNILDIQEYSLEEYNANIKLKLIKEKILSITNMLKNVESKAEAIIIFLSILELSKNNSLNIIQDTDSLEITVELKEELNE